MTIDVSNDELFSIIQSQENDVLDFKSADLLMDPNAENRYKIAKHLVGFVNHRGGKLVFGVDDDGEPEGMNILEEESLGTISEIIGARISPPIDFSYSYFSAENEDLSEGSVLVIEVQRRSSPIPHAVVEESSGKIRKREYRIRSGESTRLVSNNELLGLFEERPRTEIKTKETLHFLLDDDYCPAETVYKPRYQYTFDRHFRELGSNDETLIDKIRGGYSGGSDAAGKRLVDAQYALTISTILSHPEFIFTNKTRLLEKMDNQVNELTFNIKSIEPSDIILPDESNPLIHETEMEKPGILPGYSSEYDYFKIPESANVTIWEDFNGFDIHNDEFTLSFSVDLVEVGVGLPTPHPDSVAEPGEYGLKRQNKSNSTMDSHISVESEFKYPNQDFPEFESYRAYCEDVIDVFESVFDREDYLDQLPDNKLLQIEDKVEELYNELMEFKTEQQE